MLTSSRRDHSSKIALDATLPAVRTAKPFLNKTPPQKSYKSMLGSEECNFA
jgi:hypothetical protein